MTLAKTLFPDRGFMLGVLDRLLVIDALTESVIEKTLSGIANDNFGVDPDEHYARFKIEEARADEAMRRLGELNLNEERLLDIHRLYFDGANRIYSILEEACDICTGGESEYYCCHDLEGVSKLPNLTILNLDGYGYRRKGLCLAPLKGLSNLETLVLTSNCTSIDVLTTLAKLTSVDFRSARLTDDEMDQRLPVIEALRARNVEIKNEPIARTPKPPPSPPALVTPKPPPTGEAEPQAPEPDPRETRRSGSTWETTNGEKTSYIRIEADIVVGSHLGSGHSDSAGYCDREAFLNGQFHDTIRSDHGPAVLQEVLDVVGPKDLTHQDVKLGDGDDLRQRIRLFLAGPSALPPRAHFNYGHEFLVQAWESFNTRQRIVLSRAIVHHIEDRDAQVRSGVIRFFQNAAAADDFGALARALREDDGLFDGVVDPIQGAIGDLRSGLVRALASNIQRRDLNRTLFQLEAIRPGRASSMVPHLFATDRQWALTEAQTIVMQQPDAYKAYVDILADLKIDLYAFIHRTKGLIPDKDAESILRERMAELLEECLLCLRDPE